jgi:hypothetical protein
VNNDPSTDAIATMIANTPIAVIKPGRLPRAGGKYSIVCTGTGAGAIPATTSTRGGIGPV